MKLKKLSFALCASLSLIGMQALGSIYASGGVEKNVADSTDVTHTFLEDGTFTLFKEKDLRILLVGGGGGGGRDCAGGGGAGGFLEIQSVTLPADTYSVVVGLGGAGGISSAPCGGSGTSTKIIASDGTVLYEAFGGGWNAGQGIDGASGGGGTAGKGAGQGIEGQGFAGGSVSNRTAPCGGGGAGGVGSISTGNKGSKSGDGGPGKASDITGEEIYYAGGGGGGSYTGTAGAGGVGGGGSGIIESSFSVALTYWDDYAGKDGFGGGGGGGNNTFFDGAEGGSGVVIFRLTGVDSAAPEPSIALKGIELSNFTAMLSVQLVSVGTGATENKISIELQLSGDLDDFSEEGFKKEPYAVLTDVSNDVVFTIKDLAPNHTYYVRLVAKNDGGYSFATSVLTFKTNDLEEPLFTSELGYQELGLLQYYHPAPTSNFQFDEYSEGLVLVPGVVMAGVGSSTQSVYGRKYTDSEGNIWTFDSRKSYGYVGYMWMEAGSTYNFYEIMGDSFRLEIDGVEIHNDSGISWYTVTYSSYECAETGWHRIRVWLGGSGGSAGNCADGWSHAFGYNKDGETECISKPGGSWTMLENTSSSTFLWPFKPGRTVDVDSYAFSASDSSKLTFSVSLGETSASSEVWAVWGDVYEGEATNDWENIAYVGTYSSEGCKLTYDIPSDATYVRFFAVQDWGVTGWSQTTLYAVWTANIYAVTFNANGGSGEMSNQTFTYGVEQALAVNDFTREGYTFVGWATSAAGEVAYVDGANISVSAPTTLYAVWAPNTYIVTFNANGGSGEMSSQTFTYGVVQALVANAFTRDGHIFAGWSTSAAGEVVYADGTIVKDLTSEVDGVVDLYAIWIGNGNVQLWADGPYWSSKNIGAENPLDYGYYFWWGDTVGYKRENNKWVASDGSSTNFSFTSSNIPTYGKDNETLLSEGWITSDGVLVHEHDAAHAHFGAKWRIPTDSELDALCDNCTWTWATINGVNGYIVRGKGNYSGASIFLPAAGLGIESLFDDRGFSEGYYWSSVHNSSNSYYSRNLHFDWLSYSRSINVRHFGLPIRPVILEPDDKPEEMTHTSTTEVPVSYVWLNAYPELMSRYEGDYEAAANSVAANGINKVWECYVAGLDPTDITAKFISIITFNENSPVITWDPNVEGRIYTIEGTSTLNPLEWDTPTNETHRFFRVKVSLPQEGDEGGTTDKIIMILFDARGGSVSPDNITYESNGVLGELPMPTFEGYAFVGWFDDINGGTEYTSTTPVPHEDMTLYAVWEAETYTVTFNANGGSGEMSNQTFTYGVEQALSSNTFTLEGYGFAGWATSADGDVVYADGEVVKNLTSEANGVVDLYAKWETTYTVCFNANGGEGTMSNQAFTYSVEQALSLNTFTLKGYGFAGWATSADGDVVYADGEVVKNLASEANGVVDLYAKWETTYTVCFNANGGEGTMLNQTITHNVEQSLSSNEFKREGYAFAGWSTSPDGEVIYENTEKIKNLISEASSEIHLYAVWKSFFVYEGEHKGVQLWKDGPHWAETNIGATNPEDFGDYFWWGDRVGYKRENEQWVSRYGSSSTFSFEASNTPTYGKDFTKLFSDGWITSNGVLAPAHDAAYVKWGSKWRMPTYDDLFGLVVNCTHTWTTKNGVEGYEIKGKGDYSGASIFLPAAGYGDGTQLQLQGSCGRYLSSVPSLAMSTSNTELNFFGGSGDFYVRNTSYRSMGCSIRPVVNQQYTVRFNANGGSGYAKMPDQLFTYGIEQALSPNKFYRNGYTFAGWTTIIEERRVFLADNQVVKNLTTKTDGIVTLDAVWITHSYTQLWKDGPYWAGTNIGAEKPWDYGDYFWWGDTDGSSFFLIFNSSNTPTYGKNDATLQSEGWITSSGILAPEHDTAQAFWGTKWRMPTHTELYNLYDRCPSVWVTINGVSGYLFSSRWNGFSESIFLPAGGYGNGASLIGVNMQGFYWSSAVSRSSGDSYYLYFDSELAPTMLDTRRHFGQPIRPVVNQQYTVRFNANGGLGTMEDQTFSHGVEQALAVNAFTRGGYKFAGWSTSADGEVVYADGEVVKNLTSEANGVVELFAVWKLVDKVQLWEGGPYWATRNIGATNPEDFGLYFWWGDTVGHRPNGSSFSFSFEKANTPTYDKSYSELRSEGWITSSGVLAPSHDAARAHWGSNWRMPTDVEFDALCDNCTWTWTSVNGVKGRVVRGKGAYSGASIFLPAAGWGGGTSLYLAGSYGGYWSSVSDSGNDYNSWMLYFKSSVHDVGSSCRFYGLSVRPVSDVH